MGGHGLEVLTPAEMGEVDRLAGEAGSLGMLMDHAGRAVARIVRASFAPCRVLVLAGPGNNGGDGYVAARRLQAAGWGAAVAPLEAPRAGSLAASAAGSWRGPVVGFEAAEAARADVVIDAVFGAGLRGEVGGRVASVLAAARRVVAVDVPSGVDGGTGAARGRVRAAEVTVTFVRLKPGHLLYPGRALCGRVVPAAIGVDAGVLDAVVRGVRLWRNEPGLWRLREAGPADHKYARGTVSVVGSGGMSGAARLAAHAARRAGAGLVRLAALWGTELYRVAEPGLIVDGGPVESLLEDERRRVWVCGPGLGMEEASECLPALIGAGRQVVADGGALGACAGAPERLRGAAVLTPHAGEFERVFGAPGADRLEAARLAARLTGAVVAMKGADTIVAAPDGRAAINANATPALATAGTGDTLAGVVGAMLANGLAPFEAACAGVWLHGEAGRLAGDGLIAEDLAERLPAALRAARVQAGPVRVGG